jgi:hypothetical protein
MNLMSCEHCGAVFDLDILRADHSKDRRGNCTWFIDDTEWWNCAVCHSRAMITGVKCER